MNNKNDIVKIIKECIKKLLAFLTSKNGIFITGTILLILIASIFIGAFSNNNEDTFTTDSVSESIDTSKSESESESVSIEIDTEAEVPDSVVTSSDDTRLTLSKMEIPDTSWAYYLINRSNPIPDGLEENIEFKGVRSNGTTYYFDARVADFAQCMINDAEDDGVTLLICSAYRSLSRQTANFENSLRSYAYSKYSFASAYALTAGYIAVPGTSEHQTGLAVDFITPGYMYLDEGFEDTDAYKWLAENSYKYGFILRYPSEKAELTGINYEPWHFRFIGFEHAKAIYESGLCLEEYVERESENYPGVTFNKLEALMIPAEPAWYDLILNPPTPPESESDDITSEDSTYDSDSEDDTDSEDELPDWLKPTETESDTDDSSDGYDTDSDTDTESDSDSESDSELISSDETDTESDSAHLTETESEAEAESDIESETEPEGETETEPESDSETESNIETVSESEDLTAELSADTDYEEII